MFSFYDIQIGKQNAITRADLASLWGVSDRAARQIIAEMRADDNGDSFVIVSTSGGSGYYRTDDIKEIEHFRNECRHRAIKCMEPTRKAERLLGERRSA